jgi:very-short-patch-repair endonuclease
MLIVELDGTFHARRKEYDAKRDQFLTGFGYRVIRFSNSDAADDCAAALQTILNELRSPSPSPLPLREERV